MSTSPPNTQSAAERRWAEAELSRLITQFAPAHEELIGATRKSLRKRLPTARELVYEYKDFFVISFSPNEHGYEGVLAIRASEDGVRLYFNRGKELPDPANCCRGRPAWCAGFLWRARPRSLRRQSRALSTRPSPAIPCHVRPPAADRWSFVRLPPTSLGGVALPSKACCGAQRTRLPPRDCHSRGLRARWSRRGHIPFAS